MNQRVIYYAHSKGLYGSKREERARLALIAAGYELICPNHPDHIAGFQQEGHSYFERLVLERGITAIAYEYLPNGYVPDYVADQLRVMRDLGHPHYQVAHASDHGLLGGWRPGEVYLYVAEEVELDTYLRIMNMSRTATRLVDELTSERERA